MITLRFSSGTGIAALGVRALTWSWCAHVSIIIDKTTVIDATPEYGVAIRKIDDSIEKTQYFEVDMDYDIVIAFAKTQLGKPYDYSGCFGILIHHDMHEMNHWFCSEFVDWVSKQTGTPLVRSDHLDRITPRDLLLSPLLKPTSR